MNSFRRRIEQSTVLASVLGWMMAQWMRLCFFTSRWDRRGDAEIEAAMQDGPVMIVVWHEHILMPAMSWKPEWRRAAILTDTSPAARIAGAVQAHLNLLPFAVSSKASNVTVARDVLKLIRSGICLGLTADGPRGPARSLKDAPVEWARTTGVPVFVYAFDMRRKVSLRSWDRMLLPMPFTKGASVFLQWDATVPRRAAPEELSDLRRSLEARLNEAASAATGLVTTD